MNSRELDNSNYYLQEFYDINIYFDSFLGNSFLTFDILMEKLKWSPESFLSVDCFGVGYYLWIQNSECKMVN